MAVDWILLVDWTLFRSCETARYSSLGAKQRSRPTAKLIAQDQI